ncbi:Sodium/potassium-transporting ATPase subunit beta-2 [Echinococcus granulosus]|uniref:Sodium/potassium-transporting ATPase subunit beta-2 n=1 Tax=Echinococcus granulosus TaxID=6210 RepID=U6JI80_ECHGR|nr:Sodium/potassium-transporting ATPase subunit beta-2 [Echinococcus granulosus]EUB56393.1 Sodium/potassium-transporting ATPase subunit beta-2 [Echinococcus granulosus]CDS23808.1 sodium:potassium dependent atpase beta subunit [Echinococcus granulosus]
MSMQDFSDNLSTLSYIPPSRCPTWLYNKKDKSFLGRTCASWAKIFLYYCFFYAILSGFFLGMIMVFLQFIVPAKVPMRTGHQSLLRFQPGLGMRPIIDEDKTLIYYSSRDPQVYYEYVDNLNALISYYEEINVKPAIGFANCTNDQKSPNEPKKVCRFDLESLGPCNKSNNYGYPDDKPCVILKLNRVYGWMPDVTDAAIPHTLVSCEGQNPEDQENVGPMKFYPSIIKNGTEYGVFHNQYFPFLGQNGYTSPLVAVQFEKLEKHILILVQCRLYGATNVDPEPVKFEILLD